MHETTIIPLKKPSLTDKEIKKNYLINILKPLQKPKKTKIKLKKENKLVKKEIKNYLLLPKKKPSIAGIKSKEIKISKYYNKKDFNIAKKQFLK